MEHRIGRYIRIVSAISLSALASTPAWAEEAPKWVAPDRWFVYTVVLIVLIGTLLTLLVIRSALTASHWSLADALSEAVEITATQTDAAGVTKPVLESGKPLMITEMRASTSRVVALIGMIAILLLFLGFGTFALFSFANTGNMPDSINKVVNFLLAGLTLFAPYAVNKLSNMFESLSPRKP